MVYFRETQRFKQWWIWLPLLFVAVLMWYGAIQQIILGKPWGDRPPPTGVLVSFWIIFGIILPLVFWAIKMVTEVRDDLIHIRFFWSKKILYRELEKWEVVTYRPIREYGGWGIRFAGKRGTAYTVSGNRGVQLVLTNGKKILIGSQLPNELARAIESAHGSSQ
jgi:hypothetical protein